MLKICLNFNLTVYYPYVDLFHIAPNLLTFHFLADPEKKCPILMVWIKQISSHFELEKEGSLQESLHQMGWRFQGGLRPGSLKR